MQGLYDFLTGPALWLTFIIFFGGLLVRAAFYFGLSLERDKVFWDHFDAGWAWRSIYHWLLPWGGVSFRNQPLFGLVFFLFHLCLLGVPIFLGAHNIMWEEYFGWSLPTLPDRVADWGAVVLVACVVFLFVRRLVRPEVRIISSLWDYVLLLLTAAPFVTGYLAYHQYNDYMTWLVLHILCSEVLMIIVPFTKLGHLMLFFFTRAFIGSDMGGRRDQYGRLGARTW